jgi:hypothetical protein
LVDHRIQLLGTATGLRAPQFGDHYYQALNLCPLAIPPQQFDPITASSAKSKDGVWGAMEPKTNVSLPPPLSGPSPSIGLDKTIAHLGFGQRGAAGQRAHLSSDILASLPTRKTFLARSYVVHETYLFTGTGFRHQGI